MALELHILGPAFSLPSIDPQCLAAIAYLMRAVPRDRWVLIASSDTALSPTRDLPAIKDGTTTIGGFQNIVDYLDTKSNGQWHLDNQFSDSTDQADITAFSSHLTTHALPLLDLSLYVSSQNYTTTTRPAYTHLIPWPTQYFIPPTRRSLAKIRTEHLGLNSLDMDTVDDEERETRKARNLVPEALRSTNKHRQTVTGLVKQSQGGMRFRLDALVDALCEPLEHLLGDKRYFLYDREPSSLDCLALGYLSLALVPDVPMKWLRERMESRWPGLVAYARSGVEECFGGRVGVEDALLVDRAERIEAGGQLPWRAPELKGAKFAEKVIWNEVLDRVPLFRTTILTSPSNPESESASSQRPSPSSSAALLPTIVTATTALAAVAGYLLYAGFGRESENRRLSDMGEAGAILAGLDFGNPGPETKAEVPVMRGGVPVGLEVDVAVDEKG
ncbi:hypothetical protein N7G274_008913 [Stereocaulon virgatum]|uniref:Mitochondrial outer membrane transport complex Sam37/metaxin N-terminal domain-containing protein n=1 Tax=Stereocaulon virgatum TaxID=373712 RepID=A0ABR3ZX74_9LECA